VRHGQSTYNALGFCTKGSSDRLLLTETGYKDVRQTESFKGLKFDAIYSSSLQSDRKPQPKKF